MTVRPRRLDADGPRRVSVYQFAVFGPSQEVVKSPKPQAGRIRCHRVEQGDDEFFRQGRKRQVAVLLAEVFENCATLWPVCRRSDSETPATGSTQR